MKLLLTSLLTTLALASPIKQRATKTTYTSGSTADDITNGVCAPLTVIFARGTTERGNIGTVIGAPMFQALSQKLNGNVALQGVDYAADFNGIASGGATGAAPMTTLVAQAKSQCPNTTIALSGYSQGGQVVHYALNNQGLPSEDVGAIVYFGDPYDGRQASGSVPDSKIKEYCASGDRICEDGVFVVRSAHLSYGSDAEEAAEFIISTTGVSS